MNCLILIKSESDFEKALQILKPANNTGAYSRNKILKYKDGELTGCITHKDYMLPTVYVDTLINSVTE